MPKKIALPLTDETLKTLHSGDNLLLTGLMYAGRDAAHKRLIEALNQSKPLPFKLKGQTIYFMGPTPARPSRSIGAAGPTTSSRMDSYSPRLIAQGLKGMIGKGMRSQPVKDVMKKYKAVYFAAVGGAGAILSSSIKNVEVLAYEDLGPEALLLLEVEDFPVTVINDIYGGDLYKEGKTNYQVKA